MLEIREDNLSGEATRSLLALHLAGMDAASPRSNDHYGNRRSSDIKCQIKLRKVHYPNAS